MFKGIFCVHSFYIFYHQSILNLVSVVNQTSLISLIHIALASTINFKYTHTHTHNDWRHYFAGNGNGNNNNGIYL